MKSSLEIPLRAVGKAKFLSESRDCAEERLRAVSYLDGNRRNDFPMRDRERIRDVPRIE